MADTININNKPSIQIRSGLPSPLPDKSPSPATKLLISHGKPNFTIARTTKVEDNGNPVSPQPTANNNYNPYKSATISTSNNNNTNKFVVGTKFNGVYKPSTAAATWATNGNDTAEGNEAAKVVLRRLKVANAEPLPADEDENVPEFIRRQRRIQERLAKENVLDFENRRSGYFTHVMISPDSPNRTSFIETMASPAVVPSLEMPLPAKIEEEQQQPVVQANGHSEAPKTNGHSEQIETKPISNGHVHEDVAPEEVARAIEEVNKAVAGEDDDVKPETELVETKAVAETTPAAVEAKVEIVTPVAAAEPVAAVANVHDEAISISHTNGHASEVPSYGPRTVTSFAQELAVENTATPDPSGALGVNYGPKTVTSFAQELAVENIPTPDPSGALGVNYGPTTVTSFAQELASANNYPDTVKVVTESSATPADAELQELSKLKFDIQNDDKNEVQVTPVLRAE